MRSFAIIPAAGSSLRMGCDKLLLPWGQSTVIETLLDAWRTSRVWQRIVVLRRDQTLLAEICRQHEALVAVAPTPPADMKASVRIGLEYVRQAFAPEEDDVWLLAPADMPWLSPQVIDLLLATHDPSSPSIVAVDSGGRTGHPVLFPWRLAGEIETLGDEQGIRELLQRHPVRRVKHDDPSVLDDLDTPEDYRRLRDR